MIEKEFVFQGSSRKPYELHAVIWLPEDKSVRKLLQITHGMTEHIGRYKKLAEVLTKEGIAVAGFDLRGHGKNTGDSVCASFGEGGWSCAIEEIHMFHDILQNQFPNTEHYMLGFSLGSFLLREYLGQYSNDKVDGAIIMGTGYQPPVILSVLIKVILNEVKKAGFDNTTALVQDLSFGTYNKKFKPNRTSSDWLCADETELDLYCNDSLCRKDISSGLFADLLSSMKRTGSKGIYDNWKKETPVLLISGKEDPVGDMGKGVISVHKQMENAGMKHVRMELLNGARHDLLHEYKSDAASKAIDIILGWLERMD